MSSHESWYFIKSMHSGLVMDIAKGERGGRIITYANNGGDNQLWTWKGNVLMSKTGYALDVQGANVTAGTNAISWDHHGKLNQQWKMDEDKIISSLNGMVLDIRGGSREEGADIILWPAKYGEINNQSWQLVPFGRFYVLHVETISKQPVMAIITIW